MASLATSTMDSSFGDYESSFDLEELIGQLNWPPDAECVTMAAESGAADVYSFALTADVESSSATDLGLLKSENWNVGDAIFSDVTLDIESSECKLGPESSLTSETTCQTLGVPQFSADVAGHETSWMSSFFDFSSSNPHLETCNDFSSHGSPDSGIGTEAVPPKTDALSETAVLPDLRSFPNGDASFGSEVPVLIIPDDIAYLESLLQEQPATFEPASQSHINTSDQPTPVAVHPLPCGDPSPQVAPRKPKSQKSSRSLNTEEKRVRKRAQNRNAATRYREKKRSESLGIYEEQTKLEGKNKSLQDNVALISREIQCMKELLREIYRAKGIVE